MIGKDWDILSGHLEALSLQDTHQPSNANLSACFNFCSPPSTSLAVLCPSLPLSTNDLILAHCISKGWKVIADTDTMTSLLLITLVQQFTTFVHNPNH